MRTIKIIWFIVKCVTASLMLVILLCLTTPLLPLLAIEYEDTLVKWDIDNPYVDRSFRKWETVAVGEAGEMRIPPAWSVSGNGDTYQIIDKNGKTWAVGVVFGAESDTVQGYLRLLSNIEGEEAKSWYSLHNRENTAMRDSSISEDVVEFSDNRERTFLTLNFCKDDDTLAVFVVTNGTNDSSENFAIAQAVLYAYVYLDWR